MFGIVGMCALILLCYLLVLEGCSGGSTTPPPPPTLNAYFSWGSVNNPFPTCPSALGSCNDYLVLLDLTTGMTVTTVAPAAGTYSMPDPAGAQHQYAIYTHIQNPDGTTSDSEQTLAVSLTPQ